MTTAESLYSEKFDGYFGAVRKEILPLLPRRMGRILEVGCGEGATSRFLRNNNYCNWAGGLELFSEAAKIARTHLDRVYEGNIEQMELPIEENSLDAVLCLDVLEHLVDPERVIQKLHPLLTPNGFILASIPNVRHYSASWPLFFQGKWEYKDWGILDKTHLRFYARQTAIQLMESSGLKVDRVDVTHLWRRDRLLDLASLRIFRSFFEFQYLVRASRAGSACG